MNFISFFISAFMLVVPPRWQTNMPVAQQEARQQHKLILLNFSGSDWCGPCIRMHRDLFDHAAFRAFADTSLILVNADFPRLKKNKLSHDVEHQNELLAEKYNSRGLFPLTLLLDAEGRVLKSWEGLPKKPATDFVKEIDTEIHAQSW